MVYNSFLIARSRSLHFSLCVICSIDAASVIAMSSRSLQASRLSDAHSIDDGTIAASIQDCSSMQCQSKSGPPVQIHDESLERIQRQLCWVQQHLADATALTCFTISRHFWEASHISQLVPGQLDLAINIFIAGEAPGAAARRYAASCESRASALRALHGAAECVPPPARTRYPSMLACSHKHVLVICGSHNVCCSYSCT
jgi:hypothetical protein